MQSKAEQSKAKHSLSTGASREAPVDKRARRLNNAGALTYHFVRLLHTAHLEGLFHPAGP